MFSTIMLIALLPVAILLVYIYRTDKVSPEPPSQLLKAFFYGTLSIPLTLLVVIPMGIIGLFPSDPETIPGAIAASFIGAAIPEECTKLLMLWLLLRKNRHFNERLDGIVYAVFVSLGFAAIENILYLFDNQDSFIAVGITRGILSIPLHFACGVLMGYFYSLTRFCKTTNTLNRLMIIIVPIAIHGIYDSIIMSLGIMSENYILLAMLLFFVLTSFCIVTLLVCYSRILRLKDMDMEGLPKSCFTDMPNGYTPHPTDCSDVLLPEGLNNLTESLSRNVHEIWAYERMKEGWSFGVQRNDIIKKHPCLVPYEQLPESEKEHDRNTAIGTLKFIMNSGYRIVKEEACEDTAKETAEGIKETSLPAVRETNGHYSQEIDEPARPCQEISENI